MNLTNENFKKFINSESTVIVDFWAEWCGPCKVMGKILDTVDFKDSVGKVNIDEEIDITSEFAIRNIPTLLFFKNGEQVGKLVGAVSKEKLEEYYLAKLV